MPRRALRPVFVKSLIRLSSAVRALVFLVVAALVVPPLVSAEHAHAQSAGAVLQMAPRDVPADAAIDQCLLCHVNCSCHVGLPAGQAATIFVRVGIPTPFLLIDRVRVSVPDDRLSRPPRA